MNSATNTLGKREVVHIREVPMLAARQKLTAPAGPGSSASCFLGADRTSGLVRALAERGGKGRLVPFLVVSVIVTLEERVDLVLGLRRGSRFPERSPEILGLAAVLGRSAL